MPHQAHQGPTTGSRVKKVEFASQLEVEGGSNEDSNEDDNDGDDGDDEA